MIHFVGAGSGAPDLITVRGKKYLEEADVVIYAGSLVNPKLLEYTKDICTIYNKDDTGRGAFCYGKGRSGRQDNSKTSHR